MDTTIKDLMEAQAYGLVPTSATRFAIRYLGFDGHELGPDCKTAFCAILSANGLDGRAIDGLAWRRDDGVTGVYPLIPVSATQFVVKYAQLARDALAQSQGAPA
ncbi:hypothetical protein [Lysobacter sp. Hz 25]|uniref:hypothetical protein n=1 Tax=Lysobacter sp. Hz 25 TaxID=3383698 RepID=UPI0038D3D8DB